MRNFGCWQQAKRTKSKEPQNVEQFETMQLRVAPRCSVQLRLPERQGEKPSHRVRVRSQLQVRPCVLMQEVV